MPESAPQYCPHCGKKHVLEIVAGAFIEQGVYDGSRFTAEGQADHYRCMSCGQQFLDWFLDAAELRAVVAAVNEENRVFGTL